MSQQVTRQEQRQTNPKIRRALTVGVFAGTLAIVGGWAIAAQDKYTVKVPNGLAFSEFRGYESWQVVSLSQAEGSIAAIRPILR